MKKILSLVIASFMVLSFALSAQAVPIVFFGEDLTPGGTVPAGGNAETARDDFLSNLVGVGNEDFESFANLTSIANPGINISFLGSSGNIMANLTGLGGICDETVGGTVGGLTCGFARFATSPDNYLQSASGGFVITFDAPIAAFGFYGTDFGDFAGQMQLTLTNGAVEVLDVPAVGANGNLLFFGFIDDTVEYTAISFTNTGSGADVFGFDDMVIGDREQVIAPIPEPSAALLFAIGSLVVARSLKRKRA